MDSALIVVPRLDDTSILMGGVFAALGGISLFSRFLLARRGFRLFRARQFDVLAFAMHKQWREIVRGDVPSAEWRNNALKCEIVQSIVVQEIGAAVDKDRAGLQEFLRDNGLIERCIQKIYDGHGSGRRRAMLALGAMRVPEAIAPLSGLLDDWQLDTRMVAVQSLGRTGLPEAAAPIIEVLMVGALKVPSGPVENAMVLCFLDRPEALLPFLRRPLAASLEVLPP